MFRYLSTRLKPSRAFLAGAISLAMTLATTGVASATVLGVNKHDLVKQYLGAASSGLQTPAYRAVESAMARQALSDANDLHLNFVRVSATAYGPMNQSDLSHVDRYTLSLWMQNPVAFFSIIDTMFNDLDARNVKIVPNFIFNPYEFPAMTGETIADLIKNPHSKSRNLLKRYVRQFVGRYKARNTILFYEFSNEMNLMADIALKENCEAHPNTNCTAQGDFSSDDLVAFSQDIVSFIKTYDPSRLISSGYTLPRPAAYHLMQRPGFAPSGPDWTQDSMVQSQAVIAKMNAPFDIISVHIYPGAVMWGNPKGSEYLTLDAVAAVANLTGQKLYVGEFGDHDTSPFVSSMLQRFVDDKVDYASVWVWEFDQASLRQSFASQLYDLGPGVTEGLNQTLGAFAATQNNAINGSAVTDPGNPRVVQVWPLPCARISGQQTLYANASALSGVTSVTFSVNGRIVGSSSSGQPYTASFTPDTQTDQGVAQIAITAYSGGLATTITTPVLIGQTDASCSFTPY